MTDTKPAKNSKRQLVIVTGLSGAGKSAALHAFEDIGFQAIDNLPLTMVAGLVNDAVAGAEESSLAIGVDSRTLHFSPEDFVGTIKQLRTCDDVNLHVLFMDASDEVLMKRFSETRRPHPLGEGQLLRAAIKQEREMMVIVRDYIDGILDTSARTGAETRRIIRRRFAGDNEPKLIVTFMSFGFSNGVPRDADLVLDVRFLRNPHYVEELRPFTGRDKKVSNYVRADEGFAPFLNKVEDLFDFLLPRYKDEGKSYLTIAFGCTGGRHRSVATAEALAARATGDNMAVNLYHRELIGDEKR
ncbi:RNase adapter RapZ [Kordiimonas sp. SCSIO 12603]|uniref:RNase adapter RapZ n=1 Tax=Kordiimonas sp. SCSIO 12603 TaxID=2829596 RepID=UPI002106FBFF|nr:RNase adapter RapZ [Kordiimonas sp. SCSIO 12603]UTW58589.1 RNase adapter RapZ [Kordiimonas sp. SCSIO 12603]